MAGKQPPWTAQLVAAHLMHCPSISGKLLVVPNCYWTGYETDLLVIEAKLRIVDIEIKISRSDLKADKSKGKWWRPRPWSRNRRLLDEPRRWPEKVWKHYYAMPEDIWTDELLPSIPEASGVLLVRRDARYKDGALIVVAKHAKPNPQAKPISPGDCIDLARLCSLRMWATIRKGGGISGTE